VNSKRFVKGYANTVTLNQKASALNIGGQMDAVPKVSRVAILRNPNVSLHILYSKEAERVAKILGVTNHFAEMQVRNDKALED
jgi:hypothetical protein